MNDSYNFQFLNSVKFVCSTYGTRTSKNVQENLKNWVKLNIILFHYFLMLFNISVF